MYSSKYTPICTIKTAYLENGKVEVNTSDSVDPDTTKAALYRLVTQCSCHDAPAVSAAEVAGWGGDAGGGWVDGKSWRGKVEGQRGEE